MLTERFVIVVIWCVILLLQGCATTKADFKADIVTTDYAADGSVAAVTQDKTSFVQRNGVEIVKDGEFFGPSSTLEGTLVSGDNVFVDEEDTRLGVSCGLTSAPDTGLVVVPDTADVRLDVPTDMQPNLGTLIAE